MKIQKEIQENFYSGNRDKNLPFVINDPVRITSKPYEKEVAAVISLVETEPNIMYSVELSNGKTVNIKSENLVLIGAS